jgi:hypothetical protein
MWWWIVGFAVLAAVVIVLVGLSAIDNIRSWRRG